MAKTTTNNVNAASILVNFGQIFWFRNLNARLSNEYGDMKEIRGSLAERGWVANNAIPVWRLTTDEDLKKTFTGNSKESDFDKGIKSQQKLAVEELQARWTALKADKDSEEGSIALAVFEKLHIENGKLIVPVYAGNAGFRRSSQFENAMIDRFKDESIPAEEKILPLIPVIEKKYADEGDRLIDQQLENQLQLVGAVPISELNRLLITKKLFDNGKREIHLRKLYGQTTIAQKQFNICKANLHWPALRILDRIFLPETDDNNIPYKKLKHDDLIKLNNRFEADQKRLLKQPLTPAEQKCVPLKPDDAANYFNGLREGTNPQIVAKMMAKKDIEAMSKQNAVDFFRLCFSSVISADSRDLGLYTDHSGALNLLKNMIDAGNGEQALEALRLANEKPRLFAVFLTAQKTLSEEEIIASVNATLEARRKAMATAPVAPATAK